MKDPFEFVGKRILIMMPSEAFHQTFTLGRPVEGQEGVWIITGRVAGEVPGLGFWLTLIAMWAPNSKQADVADSGQPDPTYLVRWGHVMSARIDPPAVTELGKVGFQPLT